MTLPRSAAAARGARKAPEVSRLPWRWAGGSSVALLLLAVVLIRVPSDSRPATEAPSSEEAILTIASESQTALTLSGKAEIVFSQEGGGVTDTSGVTHLSFSGDDVDMVIEFAGREGRPGFQAHSRVVDGDFYLLDGPPGRQIWIRDTNAGAMRASDMFSFDPRTLLSALRPQVGFQQMPDPEAGLRHFRAVSPEGLSVVNLSEGPIDPKTIKSLDVWAGSDDIVQRMEVMTERKETRRPGARTAIVEENWQQRKIIAPDDTTPEVTATIRSTYSIKFSDVGEPLDITAPPGAVDVAGQG
ncbi:MAG TPA: hypothetical protein VHJ78_04980 [Actinomycetota bacterium]|nr:hypothetical protein [Actinomycetota bacterium]